ncbi:MAG: amidohydrolase family protein [Nocardioidaceae bacterium]
MTVPFGHTAVRPEWLALRTETPLAPTIPIVDPHHHLFDHPDWRYLTAELTADLAQVPGLVATVFVECHEHYRRDGPVPYRPVGETEFVMDFAEKLAMRERLPRVAAGIVGHVDLTTGRAVAEVLAEHIAAAGGRFRGIRQRIAWDPDPAVTHPRQQPPLGLYGSRAFRRGFAELARLGLIFDTWCYHPQIPEVTELARAFPDTVIVLDHFGGPLGVGRYARTPSEVFTRWRAAMNELARCENVYVKLGGLGMRSIGHHLDEASVPPGSQRLATIMRPWVVTTLELFGANRCMFESNFPIDKASYGYGTFWNACKRLTADAGVTERSALFAGTASRVYRITIDEHATPPPHQPSCMNRTPPR